MYMTGICENGLDSSNLNNLKLYFRCTMYCISLNYITQIIKYDSI